MAGPWTFDGEIARTSSAGGAVTLVHGADFCLSSGNGDIRAADPHGLFLLDSRFLSRLELRVDGWPVEALGVAVDDPHHATFFCRVDADVVVVRRRFLDRGLDEDVVVRNHGTTPRTVHVELAVEADFADVFEVKERRVQPRGWYGHDVTPEGIRLARRDDGHERAITVALPSGAHVAGTTASWQLDVEPGAEHRLAIEVRASLDGRVVEPAYEPARLAEWRRAVPDVDTDDASLDAAVRQAGEDLGALRIFDPEHRERAIVAAGAPWYMTPFGRDSLLTAWMALIVDPTLALGVLQTLADFQGERVDLETEEQPGRILHELRFDKTASLALGGGSRYYGTADATPLFVMLLGEAHRWGVDPDAVERLVPHADRALEWVEHHGDLDGDGYVEYRRTSSHGLANQGWKDSWDGIRYADGRVAEAPIALAEVQAYVYAAWLARAHLAIAAGDQARADHCAARARTLRTAFNRDFWLPEQRTFAVGLDAEKRPIDSVTSNPGHCLWTGIVDEGKAAGVAASLVSPAMFSGWGVRTLAADEPGYNPISYHCGSVWPHDSAIAAAGLVRYGFVEEAHRIVRGLLDVADGNAGRLPEVFAGVGRDELGVPAAYPTSCSPQAWAAASPLLVLRLLLRFEPSVPRRELIVAPALPPWLGRLHVAGVPFGDRRLDVTVEGDQVSVLGAEGLTVRTSPRRPQTRLLE